MASLTISSPRTTRSFARSVPPIKETRVAPRPESEQDALPTGRCTPIDQRELPTVNGAGLTEAERQRVVGAENRARAAYADGCPEASFSECFRVGRLAAQDELRRLLKERPAAPELKPAKTVEPVASKPSPAKPLSPLTWPVRRPVRLPIRGAFEGKVSDRQPYTAMDAAWWAANSSTSQSDFCTEGTTDPSDVYLWTMPAIEFRELVQAACFGEPELSDDANGAFGMGCHAEGGAL